MSSSQLLLLAPSPATFHAVPYTEPFAACLTFAGMLAWSRARHRQRSESLLLLFASFLWALASMFRAQACVLGIGFFGWQLLLRRPWTPNARFNGKVSERTDSAVRDHGKDRV
jgi:hypothetical protein